MWNHYKVDAPSGRFDDLLKNSVEKLVQNVPFVFKPNEKPEIACISFAFKNRLLIKEL